VTDRISVQGRPIGQWLSPGAADKAGGQTARMFAEAERIETLLEWHLRKGSDVSDLMRGVPLKCLMAP